MVASDLSLWRWIGILLLASGIIFWIGAFTPPYRWWMASDVKEYLTLNHDHTRAWYFIAGTFLLGVLLSVFGMQFFSIVLQQAGQKLFPQIGLLAFAFGSIFWILNIAFRVTVTVWAAKQLTESQILDPSFQTWMDWTNLIFAIYMVLAYFGIGCMGYSLHQLDVVPNWTSWVCMIMGFGGSLLYICRVPVFDPPLMVHLPLMITAIMILINTRIQ